MKIQMLETRQVSEDRHSIQRLKRGLTYDIADSTARHCIINGWAIEPEPPEPLKQFIDDTLEQFRSQGIKAEIYKGRK